MNRYITAVVLLAVAFAGGLPVVARTPVMPNGVVFDFEDGSLAGWMFTAGRSYSSWNGGGSAAQVHDLIASPQGTEIVHGAYTLKLGGDLHLLSGTPADWHYPFSGEMRSPVFTLGSAISFWRSLHQMGLDESGVWSDGYYLELRDASTDAVVLPIERYAGNTLNDISTSLDDLLTGSSFDPGLQLIGTVSLTVPPALVGRDVYLAVGFWGNDRQEAGFVLLDDIVITPADSAPPLITCDTPDGLWHPVNVTVQCTAEDGESGLASPTDASFVLSTNVPDGIETSTAATNSHSVCDAAGNCATAGPLGGFQIDRKAPAITLSSPAGTSYVLGQPVLAAYQCVDAGSGLDLCAGTVPNNQPVATATPGTEIFTVTASDAVGNTTTQSVTYTVAYKVCVLFDQSKAHKIGSTIPIRLQLCNHDGQNVSTPEKTVVATAVMLIATNAPGPVEDSGNANPDLQFRFAADVEPGGGYIFNLSTKNFSQGTYALTFTVDGGQTAYVVQFQVK